MAAAVALLAGCSGGPAKPASAGQPAASHSATAGLAVGAQRKALAARYLAIAQAGNKRLEVEFDQLHREDRLRLAAAHRDLREIAATERLFDQRLPGIPFPGGDRADRAVPELGQPGKGKHDRGGGIVAVAGAAARRRAPPDGGQQAGRAGGRHPPRAARTAAARDELTRADLRATR
jgi:hypothetical protein